MPSVLVGRMVFVHFLGSRGVRHGNVATYHASLVCLLGCFFSAKDATNIKGQKTHRDDKAARTFWHRDGKNGSKKETVRKQEIKGNCMRARKIGKKTVDRFRETRRVSCFAKRFLRGKEVAKESFQWQVNVCRYVPFRTIIRSIVRYLKVGNQYLRSTLRVNRRSMFLDRDDDRSIIESILFYCIVEFELGA